MESFNLIIIISIIIAVIAFVVLVVFLVMTLISLVKSLKRTDALIHQSNEIAKNVNDKLHTLDPLFDCVHHVNKSIEAKARTMEHISEEIEEEYEEREEKLTGKTASILEIIEWGLIGASLIVSLRKKHRGGRR